MPSNASIPMNDLGRLFAAHQPAVEAAALETLRSGWWLNGPRMRSFADRFAEYLGVSICIPVANGTDALELALRALSHQCRPGAEIVTVANAGGYTTTACRQVGLVPVYADIEVSSQLLAIESAVAGLSEHTAAVVATHLYGNTVDVPALRSAMDAAGYKHVAIIEDCAQSHGASIGATMAGALGDLATFSFYPTKNLGAVGDGGAVATNDPTLADTIRRLQQYGWRTKYEISHAGGRNSRMDEIQAAILETMLPHLDAQNAERQQILDRYSLVENEQVRFIARRDGSIVHLAVALCSDRQGFRKFLTERNIASDIHYPILDTDQAGWSGLPMRESSSGLKASRDSVARILSLPCFPGMTEGEVDRVCSAIVDWKA